MRRGALDLVAALALAVGVRQREGGGGGGEGAGALYLYMGLALQQLPVCRTGRRSYIIFHPIYTIGMEKNISVSAARATAASVCHTEKKKTGTGVVPGTYCTVYLNMEERSTAVVRVETLKYVQLWMEI